jgi:MFS family permease
MLTVPLDSPRRRRLMTFLVSYCASALGAAMAPVGITFALLDAGRSAGQVGAVLAVYTAALAAALLVGGVAADTLGRRQMMMLGELLGAGSQLTLAALVLGGQPALWEFMVLLAVAGTGQALYGPAMMGLIPELADGPALQQANALSGLAASVAAMAGAAAAGAVAGIAGPGWAIVAAGSCYLLSAAGLVLLPGLGPVPPAEPVLAQLRSGWLVFRRLNWLWAISCYDAAGTLLISAPYVVLGAVVARTSLGGAGAWGAILAAQGAGAMAGAVIVQRIRPARPLVVAMIARFALLAPLLGLILHAPVPVIVMGACLTGVGFELFQTLWSTTLQQHVPAASLSRVSAFDALAVTSLAPAGYGLVGLLSVVLGVTGTLWLAAVALIVLTGATTWVPPVRRLRAHPDTGSPGSADRGTDRTI